jgi:phosphopentomutase
MDQPLATAAGNALEVHAAVEILAGGTGEARLAEVSRALGGALLALHGIAPDAEAARRRSPRRSPAAARPNGSRRWSPPLAGRPDIVAQAGRHLPRAPVVRDVVPARRGIVTAIDGRALGMAVVRLGGGRRVETDRIDPAVGLDRLARDRRCGRQPAPAGPGACRRYLDRRRGGGGSARRLSGGRRAGRGAAGDPRPGGMSRAFLIVMDSVGCGGAPDAAEFRRCGRQHAGPYRRGLRRRRGRGRPLGAAADAGARPAGAGRGDPAGLGRGRAGAWRPADRALGRGDRAKPRQGHPVGALGTGRPAGALGLALFPRYASRPFPPELAAEAARLAGTDGILGNEHASGTEIIARLGPEHLRTGWPICYTSADSVFQIAAHETAFGLDRLLQLCQALAPRLHAMRVGRVIARPFIGDPETGFTRTANRHDYACAPPGPTLLDRAEEARHPTHAIGKISDIFSGRGIGHSHKGKDDAALFDHLDRLAETAEDGALVFANFVEFDALYGHRRDVAGYARALEWFDARVGGFLPGCGPATSPSLPPIMATTRPGVAPTTPERGYRC